MAPAPLTEEQRLRYARHLLLPELGETGQVRLLASRVRFAENERADAGVREVAEEYLRRAGVGVERESAHAHDYENVNVDENVLELDSQLGLESSVELVQAARALRGAFVAVEAIKAIAELGRPGRLERDLLSAEDV